MNIKKIKELKQEMEEEVYKHTYELVKEFSKRTGTSPYNINVTMVALYEPEDTEPTFVLGKISANIKI